MECLVFDNTIKDDETVPAPDDGASMQVSGVHGVMLVMTMAYPA